MKIYYRDSIDTGDYIAARGVTDTWNLHFVEESYPLYDRLIENAILFDGVDPNRVYVMGFSAGGDGVYQIATRMADRFAAAAMSAGHHNNVSPDNLRNLPFLAQVGERDTAYKRHHATVDFFEKLEKLAADNPGFYVHQLNVHANRGHNFPDNVPYRRKYAVIRAPVDWRDSGDRSTDARDTNAAAWLATHVRQPLPATVIWDLKTTAPRAAKSIWRTPARGKRHYWLSSGSRAPADLGSTIRAYFVQKINGFSVTTDADGFEIMLSSRMVDFNRPIAIRVNGTTLPVKVAPTRATMLATLAERGDPNYLFEAVVTLTRATDGSWSASPQRK